MIPQLLIGHAPWSLHCCPCACLTCASFLWSICLVANFVGCLCTCFSTFFHFLNKFWQESLFDEISPVNEAKIPSRCASNLEDTKIEEPRCDDNKDLSDWVQQKWPVQLWFVSSWRAYFRCNITTGYLKWTSHPGIAKSIAFFMLKDLVTAIS